MPTRGRGYAEVPCEQQFKRVKGFVGIVQVLAAIEAEHAEPQSAPTKKAA
jgi:hypothetical protein